MKARYRSLRARATAASPQPLVMTGRSTRGRFVIAGGRSYVAALIADAGGRYAWADNTSAGAPAVDLEAQIQRAADADIWINGGGWRSRAEMLKDEPRYAAFKAYRNGQVWVYESGNVIGPQRLLVAERVAPRSRAGGSREDLSPFAARASRPRVVHAGARRGMTQITQRPSRWFHWRRRWSRCFGVSLADWLDCCARQARSWSALARMVRHLRAPSRWWFERSGCRGRSRRYWPAPRSASPGCRCRRCFEIPSPIPFALGISAGASLGVALVVLGTVTARASAFGAALGLRGDALITAAAIAGAALVLALVLAVSVRIANPTTVLILGLMFGYAVSAVVTVLVGDSPGAAAAVGAVGIRIVLRRDMAAAAALCATDRARGRERRGDDEAVERAAARRELRAVDGPGRPARARADDGRRVDAWRRRDGVLRADRVSRHRRAAPVPRLAGHVRPSRAGAGGRADGRRLSRSVRRSVSLLPGSAGVLPLNAVTSFIGAPVVVGSAAAQPARSVAGMTTSARAHAAPSAGTARARTRSRLSRQSETTRRARAASISRCSRRAGVPAGSQRHRQVDAAAHTGRLQPALWGRSMMSGAKLVAITQAELARRLGVVLTERVLIDSLRARRIVELGRYPHSGWFGGRCRRDHRAVSMGD